MNTEISRRNAGDEGDTLYVVGYDTKNQALVLRDEAGKEVQVTKKELEHKRVYSYIGGFKEREPLIIDPEQVSKKIAEHTGWQNIHMNGELIGTNEDGSDLMVKVVGFDPNTFEIVTSTLAEDAKELRITKKDLMEGRFRVHDPTRRSGLV